MIRLRAYQEEAVDKLSITVKKLLSLKENKTIVFKAPTGSGKTIVMAAFLKQLSEISDDVSFAFVWAAPRKLHAQSKEKLENYFFESKALRCSYFEDLVDKKISNNEILFLNWESINKKDNVYIRDNEQDFNLSSIINNTVYEDRKIILIIDESHHTAKSENSEELKQMIQAKVTIEVSATPHMQADEAVTVYREKVIEEGMIKKQVSINPDFKNIVEQVKNNKVSIKTNVGETTNEFILKTALHKREQLKKLYEESGVSVNPLILIQLPDRRGNLEEVKDEVVDILKDKHSITVDNRKLGIYLSESKENLENISRNDDETEVMLFKQAIALGWDCPRASILVLFRDWSSSDFSIQTVGRILRMPEFKHYENGELNNGYVFTNLSDISILEDLAGGYVTVNHAKRKSTNSPLDLVSVHTKRNRETTRLNIKYIHCFLDAVSELDLKNGIDTNVGSIDKQLISDGVIKDPDRVFEHLKDDDDETHDSDFVLMEQTDIEVQNLFDNFIIENLHPYFPEKRSVGRIKEGIYRFYQQNFPTKFEYGGIDGQKVVLSSNNKQLFINAINLAKEKYSKLIEKADNELVKIDRWTVPAIISYSENYSPKKVKLSLVEPYYEFNQASGVEKSFVEFLETSNDVEWWFKNGERDGTFFAVPYIDKGIDRPFYVDWIVKYKNGMVGLYDTKGGITAETAGPRAEGLAKYIELENKKGKSLIGGIVIERNGSFWINSNDKYEYNENDLLGAGWRILE